MALFALSSLADGGPLTESLGWRWIFFLNVPIGVLMFVVCLLLLTPGL